MNIKIIITQKALPQNINVINLSINFFWSIEEAITEEKRIKGGSRLAKLKLINEINPNWNDLYETLD